MKRFLVASFLIACGSSPPPANVPEPTPVPTAAPPPSASMASSSSEPAPLPAASQDAAQPPPKDPEPDYDGRLAKARKLRDGFIALKAPKLAKAASKEEALKFIQTKVKSWYDDARPKVDATEAAYVEALKSARSPMERATVFGEAADLHTTFVERFIESGNSGLPVEWKKQPDIAEVFESAIRSAAGPWVAKARGLVAKCATAMPNDAKCAAVDKRVTALESASKP